MSTADPKQLRALAALLDCSSDAFCEPRRLPEELGELVELFDLWMRIDSEESRSRLLSFARELTQADLEPGTRVTDRAEPSH